MKNDRERYRHIKEHFNSEAGDFDSGITARVPFYGLFIEALVNVLPFEKEKAIRVADLGCGTGAVALRVKKSFPNAEIHCVDLSPEMLTSARGKLSGYTGITYQESDLLKADLKGYDVIVSSLCLHHIGEEKEKKDIFKKIYNALLAGGVFYIYDVILASNGFVQDVCLEEWKKFMSSTLSPEDIEKTIRNYREEDRPFTLMKELGWLNEAGFKDVDVICKFYNGAVYGGVKRD
ncbi:MAG: class I SAM-dependent methyltransferase [Candidatus Omnitrophica bacterium]|nr:class I SAM-dependent methyltransferase [Candidatus Omnitrophota bacterium]MDD4013900.1 class I SAM-dependent methyltransferase [Candidatus Omnitrophota bacterium]